MDEKFNLLKSEITNFKELVDNGNIFMPLELLRDKKLTYDEKIYLSIYYSYEKNIKITDEKVDFNQWKLSKVKKKLYKLNYLKKQIIHPNIIKEKTIQLSYKGKKCDWCGNECYILQKHHYPILAKDGGKEIVNICPNCHYTYHSLLGEQYE